MEALSEETPPQSLQVPLGIISIFSPDSPQLSALCLTALQTSLPLCPGTLISCTSPENLQHQYWEFSRNWKLLPLTAGSSSAPTCSKLWVLPAWVSEFKSEHEFPAGVYTDLINDVKGFGDFLNNTISTEHTSRKEIFSLHKNSNNWRH